jgi:hypothetical protein
MKKIGSERKQNTKKYHEWRTNYDSLHIEKLAKTQRG